MKKNNNQNQPDLPLKFGERVDRYIETRLQLRETIKKEPDTHVIENEFEACILIAMAIKKAMKEADISRDQLVDGINEYFGRSEESANDDPPTSRKPLTLHMLNNYLSKPQDYPIPAYFLFAIHHVCDSLEPAQAIVEPAGATIATGEEIQQMTMGKIEKTMDEMRLLKKQLKKQFLSM